MKLNLLIAVMTLLLLALSSQTLGRRVIAQGEGMGIETGDALTCLSLSGCCGAAGCSGAGTPNGCAASCVGGGSITCAKVVNGICT